MRSEINNNQNLEELREAIEELKRAILNTYGGTIN